MNNYRIKDIQYLKNAIELAKQGILNLNGGPFGAIIVKEDKIIGEGFNQVTSLNDPTAHAEIVAIRNACNRLNSFKLEQCTIYSTCEPCPMCLGAIYWARIKRLVFSSGRVEAKKYGFDDELIYKEIELPYNFRKIETLQIHLNESIEIFKQWDSDIKKQQY